MGAESVSYSRMRHRASPAVATVVEQGLPAKKAPKAAHMASAASIDSGKPAPPPPPPSGPPPQQASSGPPPQQASLLQFAGPPPQQASQASASHGRPQLLQLAGPPPQQASLLQLAGPPPQQASQASASHGRPQQLQEALSGCIERDSRCQGGSRRPQAVRKLWAMPRHLIKKDI